MGPQRWEHSQHSPHTISCYRFPFTRLFYVYFAVAVLYCVVRSAKHKYPQDTACDSDITVVLSPLYHQLTDVLHFFFRLSVWCSPLNFLKLLSTTHGRTKSINYHESIYLIFISNDKIYIFSFRILEKKGSEFLFIIIVVWIGDLNEWWYELVLLCVVLVTDSHVAHSREYD